MHAIEIFFISAFILCVSQTIAFAQTNDPIELERICTFGTKMERFAYETPANITFITEDRLDKKIARDIFDSVCYEPKVSLSGTGNRFDLDYVNIDLSKSVEIFKGNGSNWADPVFIQEGSAFQRYTQPRFYGGINLKYRM